ncbi:unnamed protein product [Sphagnum balticum]
MSLVDRFLTGEYVVKRTGRGSYVKGFYQPGPMEEFTVCGSMQPTSARELKMPEEGNRLKQYWVFYTDCAIVTDSERTLATGDKVNINGDEYRAMALTSWHGTDLDYFKTVLWHGDDSFDPSFRQHSDPQTNGYAADDGYQFLFIEAERSRQAQTRRNIGSGSGAAQEFNRSRGNRVRRKSGI